jgi:site-specific DNA-methyltransferase (adenine-specific)
MNMKLSEIKPNPSNPRIIKDDKFAKLVQSIKDFPQMLELRPIVINSDNIVLGGNMRLRACKEAGLKEVPVMRADDLTPEQQAEFIIKDNVGFGEWDWDMLANQWDADKLNDWGLDVPDFEATKLEAEEDDFDVPEGGIETDIVLGDLFEIGQHRLLCGDSTDSDQVAKLMNGERASFAIADPPYNVGYEYNSHKDNKSVKEYEQFCNAYTNNALLHSPVMAITPGKANEKIYTSRPDYKEYLIWFKKFGLSRGSFYKAMVTEPILLFGEKPKNKFYSTDCLEFMTEREEGLRKLHSCPKPVKLFEAIIEPMTEQGEIVLEMFGGSGTTLICCHQMKRVARAIEIDPKYCQVIVDRMLKLDPTLEVKRNGIPYIKTVE